MMSVNDHPLKTALATPSARSMAIVQYPGEWEQIS
jgi:hypothetical protein